MKLRIRLFTNFLNKVYKSGESSGIVVLELVIFDPVSKIQFWKYQVHVWLFRSSSFFSTKILIYWKRLTATECLLLNCDTKSLHGMVATPTINRKISWKMWGHRSQRFSPKIMFLLHKNWDSKSWMPFWIYKLISTANPALIHSKWDSLAYWKIQNISHGFDF